MNLPTTPAPTSPGLSRPCLLALVAVGLLAGCGETASEAPAPAEDAARTFITIGTGGVTGVYYATGGAICRLVNKNTTEHGVRCSVEATGGSIYNLNTIAAGELDMGVAQSDMQHYAYHGTQKFAPPEGPGANPELRSVFSVHAEPFTVVARADAEIATFADLKGKRVNIGNPGSGQRGTMEELMAALGWTTEDFQIATELKSAEQAKALCDNKIDAMVITVGHPSGLIKEASTACDVVLLNVAGPEVDKLVADNAYYRHATIPGGTYRGTDADVSTFGVGATFVSSTKTPAETVHAVVAAVFDNFEDFKKLHPAFAVLTKEKMVGDDGSAPLHDGAARYYRAAGLLAAAEVPAEELTGAEVPAAELTGAEVPAEELTGAEVPAEELTAAETPAEELTAAEVPAEDLTAAEVPAEDLTAAETPAEELTPAEAPAEGTDGG